ncbi:MAG: hypothetical protein BMS9Abin15_0766 [Gammaproteobacteria bacterium]|nr:MAG: hypothetical protein BMS9Abin15_0766 [Gammaproteobacteria bacterium]
MVRGKPLPIWEKEFDCCTRAQFFLKLIQSYSARIFPIPGTSNPKHLIDNQQAGSGRLPDMTMRKCMVDFIERI